MSVLKKDNEENADLALKIIIEIQRFYKANWDVMVSLLLSDSRP